MKRNEIKKLAEKIANKMQMEDGEFGGRFEDIITVLQCADELGCLKTTDQQNGKRTDSD
jgi:hypothetical protein